MGKTLDEYAKEYGLREPPVNDDRTAAEAAAERAAQITEAQRLKESIAAQLETGAEPQYILYAALECIGLLTRDADFSAAGRARLDDIYGDLAQESFVTDNAAIAAKRLRDETDAYNERLRKQLTRQANSYKRIARLLNDALADLDALEAGRL